jgi:hypothetical protein
MGCKHTLLPWLSWFISGVPWPASLLDGLDGTGETRGEAEPEFASFVDLQAEDVRIEQPLAPVGVRADGFAYRLNLAAWRVRDSR